MGPWKITNTTKKVTNPIKARNRMSEKKLFAFFLLFRKVGKNLITAWLVPNWAKGTSSIAKSCITLVRPI